MDLTLLNDLVSVNFAEILVLFRTWPFLKLLRDTYSPVKSDGNSDDD